VLTSYGRDANDIVTSIRLEGGQELSLSITRKIEENGDPDLLVKFGYKETNPSRAARLWWQRLKLRRGREQHPNDRGLWDGASTYARLILVISVVVISVVSYLTYLTLKSRQTTAPEQISSVPIINPESAKAPTTTKAPEPDGRASPPVKNERPTVAKAPATVRPSPNANAAAERREEEAADNVTRSSAAIPNLTLKEVKKIYIEMRGDAELNDLRNSLNDGLTSSGVVAAASSADDADAALKIVVSQTSTSAQLVNARGTVLWPTANRRTRRYSGETSKVVSDIIEDLVSEIRLARGEP
jgi:hypothetical protein